MLVSNFQATGQDQLSSSGREFAMEFTASQFERGTHPFSNPRQTEMSQYVEQIVHIKSCVLAIRSMQLNS